MNSPYYSQDHVAELASQVNCPTLTIKNLFNQRSHHHSSYHGPHAQTLPLEQAWIRLLGGREMGHSS